MKKSAYKILLVLFILSIILILPLTVSAQGNVKGIFDSLKKYREEQATSSSLKEIKKDFQELNQVRNQLSQEVVKKKQELLEKSKESVIEYLDKWSGYLNKVEEELGNYDPIIVAGIKEKIEAEIIWISAKKEEVIAVTSIEQLRTIVVELRERRRLFLLNLGEIRSRRLQNHLSRLEERLNRLNNLLSKFGENLNRFAQRGVDVTNSRVILAQLQVDLNQATTLLEQAKEVTVLDEVKQEIDEIQQIIKKITTGLGEIMKELKPQVTGIYGR
ncbi:hypothetical protein A2W14_02435 [Candidatus Gottesmanbacteria bacterium RBG_16_37_8]|uniref:Uncharacterized protein n=1 Tax=Candidatus Gottesmanbacteria bacterium RBG_16_37_8 TaxID=1798371 RepID=A0A1F5YT88_9BACT|nr:MAG: hypothetical protein A2W14_02435 [Candidatus Gottesmanbacteria bacterium RBG_16_37_8]